MRLIPISVRKIFHDIELQKKFDDDGYVIIPFLSEAEVEELSAFYTDNTITQDSQGLHSSILSDDKAFKQLAFEKITAVFELQASKYLFEYVPVLAQFLVKEAKTSEKFNLHLDPALTDETKYAAVSIWCGLDDISTDNGAMFVKRIGHKTVNFVRAAVSGRQKHRGHRTQER